MKDGREHSEYLVLNVFTSYFSTAIQDTAPGI